MALREYSRQRELWALSADQQLPPGHLARFIDEVVERLGVERLNRKYRHTPGEPAYDVRLLLKVFIFAYAEGITSSRAIDRQCQENIAFHFLTRGQCPDHRTLSTFRRRKKHLLRWVFKQTVRLARQLGIVRLGLVAIDSVKMPAHASRQKVTAADVTAELKALEEYLRRVSSADREQDDEFGEERRGDELPAEIQSAQRRQEKLKEAMAVLQKASGQGEGRKDVSLSDPEAVWVKKGSRMIRGYSAEVAADAEQQIIVAVKAIDQALDTEQLNPMVKEIEKTAGAAAEKVVADSGYYTDDAVLEAKEGNSDCFVPDCNTAARLNGRQKDAQSSTYDWTSFDYDPGRDEFICPRGKRLVFVKHHHRRTPTKIYQGLECENCPVRALCTDSPDGRRVVQVRPEHQQIRELRMKVQSEKGIKIYKKRKSIIEPIFGRWQHNWGVRRLRLRRLSGCSIEVHLLAIAHNLTKLYRKAAGSGRLMPAIAVAEANLGAN